MLDQVYDNKEEKDKEANSDSSSESSSNSKSNSSTTSTSSSSNTTLTDSIEEFYAEDGKKEMSNGEEKIPLKLELMFLLFGTVILTNYNIFINGIDFFVMLFPDNDGVTTNIARVHNIGCSVAYFLSIGFIERFNVKLRYFVSIVVQIAVALFFLIYCNVGSPNLTVIYVVEGISSVFTAIIDGTTFGLSGMFGGHCTTMVASGLAVAGAIAAVCRILSKLMGAGEGWFYFGMSLLIYVISFCTYLFSFLKMDIVKERIKGCLVSNDFCFRMKRFSTVMKKTWIFFIEAFVCMAITLTLFPGYLCRTQSKHGLSVDWVTTTITSTFMVGDLISRLGARFWQFPSAKYLYIPQLLRLIFFVLICISIEGIAIVDDIWIYFMSFMLAFTGGYYITLCLTYTAVCPILEPEEVELATFLNSVGLNLGIFTGSWLTYAMPGL